VTNNHDTGQFDITFESGRRAYVILLLISLFVAPVIVGFQSDTDYDIIRSFVITEAVIVCLLYLGAFAKSAYAMAHQRILHTATEGVVVGSMLRDLGIVLILVEQIVASAQRLGNPVFNARTPILQFALLLFLLSWMLIERREWEFDAIIPKQEGS